MSMGLLVPNVDGGRHLSEGGNPLNWGLMTLLLLLACTNDNISSSGETGWTDADADTDADTDVPTNATLSGDVFRSVPAAEDGVGDLYVAVFDADPVWASDTAQVVGRQLITGADLSADGAAIAYRIEDIPPRGSAYYVLGFLDDNGNVDPSGPAPDKGDLITFDLNTFGAPQVLITSGGEVVKDVDLNAEMPF